MQVSCDCCRNETFSELVVDENAVRIDAWIRRPITSFPSRLYPFLDARLKGIELDKHVSCLFEADSVCLVKLATGIYQLPAIEYTPASVAFISKSVLTKNIDLVSAQFQRNMVDLTNLSSAMRTSAFNEAICEESYTGLKSRPLPNRIQTLTFCIHRSTLAP